MIDYVNCAECSKVPMAIDPSDTLTIFRPLSLFCTGCGCVSPAGVDYCDTCGKSDLTLSCVCGSDNFTAV